MDNYVRKCLICFTDNPPGLHCPACQKIWEEAVHRTHNSITLWHRQNTTKFELNTLPAGGIHYDPIDWHGLKEELKSGSPMGKRLQRKAGRFYPRFEAPRPEESRLIIDMASLLQVQTGLTIAPSQILVAPWAGGGSEGRRTVRGELRDAKDFWRAFEAYRPEIAALLHGRRSVSKEYARYMSWPDWTIGQPLEHHHINHAHYVHVLPREAHGGRVHGDVRHY